MPLIGQRPVTQLRTEMGAVMKGAWPLRRLVVAASLSPVLFTLLVGVAGVLSTAPHDVSTAVLALVIVIFGLTQRLTNPSTCAAPTPRP